MIDWIFNNGMTVLGFGGYVLVGIFAFIGFFKRTDVTRRQESDQLADGLIKRLQQTVDQQTTDITALRETSETQQKEIHLLQGSNEAYLKILALRDPLAEKVFKEAPAIFEIAKENNVLSRHNGEAITTLTETLSKFIQTIQPVLIHAELMPAVESKV